MISFRDIQRMFAGFGFKTPYAEVNQIVAYFTAGDMLNVDQFVRTCVAWIEGFDSNDASSLFDTLFDSASEVPVEQVLSRINAYGEYPEIVEGFRIYLESGYARTKPGTLFKSEFITLHSDMYSAAPDVYDAVKKSIWDL